MHASMPTLARQPTMCTHPQAICECQTALSRLITSTGSSRWLSEILIGRQLLTDLVEEGGHDKFNEVDLGDSEGGSAAVHERRHWQPLCPLLVTLHEKLLQHPIRPPARKAKLAHVSNILCECLDAMLGADSDDQSHTLDQTWVAGVTDCLNDSPLFPTLGKVQCHTSLQVPLTF